jgi:putrescine aminotransferase
MIFTTAYIDPGEIEMDQSRTATKPGMGRREFLATGAAATLGAVLPPAAGATNGVSASRSNSGAGGRYFSYPPYESAAASDAAYARFVTPGPGPILSSLGINVHYGVRENARVQDVYTKKWFWDCHRGGSTFNLGHRNQDLRAAMDEALRRIGNAGSFLQLSGYRAKLVEKLLATTKGGFYGATFGVSGTEANEIAIHAARNHTHRRGLVAISGTSVHGSTDLTYGVSGAFADTRERYLIDNPNTTFVDYNDIDAMDRAVTYDTAAVIMELSPAQGGFPVPKPGYLESVKQICSDRGAVMILDEVQTGLGGTGRFWGYEHYGFVPDILTVGKGFGGGVYPISAAVMSESVWHSYNDGNIIPHDSTYAGSELGCVVAAAVLEVTGRQEFLQHTRQLAARFAEGFAGAPFNVNQIGLCMGLSSNAMSQLQMCALLAANGVLAIPSLAAPVVVFRPILTLSMSDADDIISRVRSALG